VGLPGAFASPADSLVFVPTGAGVATVPLAAVVDGVARLEGRVASERDGGRGEARPSGSSDGPAEG
jgi:hypothetical protein